MNHTLSYQKIDKNDYGMLTKIMTDAFDEDTRMHTNLSADGPTGYNNGELIKWLIENENFESYKIILDNKLVGAYTVEAKQSDEYSLEMLFIDPNYREFHLGTIVWNNIEQKYKTAKRWTVETPDYSTRNHYFYTKKCGFTFASERVHENGVASFVFVKDVRYRRDSMG